VAQLPARANVADGRKIAALVMNGRQAVARELLRNVREPVTRALRRLFRGEGGPPARAPHRVARTIGDASVELAARVLVERPALGIRRVLRYPGQLERAAVVERRVPPAVLHDDGMVLSKPDRDPGY
jgi:hypothetical protein